MLFDTVHEVKPVNKRAANKKIEAPLYICPVCGAKNHTWVKYCSKCKTYPEAEGEGKINIRHPDKHQTNLKPLWITLVVVVALIFLAGVLATHR